MSDTTATQLLYNCWSHVTGMIMQVPGGDYYHIMHHCSHGFTTVSATPAYPPLKLKGGYEVIFQRTMDADSHSVIGYFCDHYASVKLQNALKYREPSVFSRSFCAPCA